MATLALSYDEDTKPAVVVAASGMPVPVSAISAPSAIVQRSGDGGITWKTVRGLADAPIDGSGNIPTTDDYEFRPDATSTYRVGTVQTLVDQFDRTVASGSWGTPSSGSAWVGANAILSVSTGKGRATHSSANTSVDVFTTGDFGDATLEATVTMSAASLTGGPAETWLYARYVDANNHYRVSLEWQTDGDLLIALIARRASVSVEVVPQFVLPFAHSGSATSLRVILECEGNTVRATVYDLAGAPPATPTMEGTVPLVQRVASGAWGVRSVRATGNSNVNLATVWDDVWFDGGSPSWLDTDTVTPTVSRFYLESTARSFLNVAPMVIGVSEISRDGRGGQNYVVGRTLPIGQVELMTGRGVALTIRVPDLAAQRGLDYLLASGDVLFLQVPTGCKIPGGYFMPHGQAARFVRAQGDPWLVEVPLVEVAAPGPDIVTAQSTWETVLALYGTWEDVIAANPTWEDVLALVGDPSEVIVP